MHGFQIRRNASALLDRAGAPRPAKDLEKAEQSLSQYLNIRRDDGPAWEWYARVVDQRDSDRRRRDGSSWSTSKPSGITPATRSSSAGAPTSPWSCGRYNDAQRHLTSLLETVPKDSQGQPAATELAELEDLLGQCDRGLTRYEEAEKWFRQALEHDPARVSCYDRLARLPGSTAPERSRRRHDPGDGREEPQGRPGLRLPLAVRSGVLRRRPTTSDIQEALELAPDDPEVLLTAAIASEQKPDAAAARAYFEKGFKLDPKNLAFALGLARLETRERHLDRAEAVLRQAFQAKPSVALAFDLAENLILQDKIEGKDQAADYIARLRNAGLGDTLVRYPGSRDPVPAEEVGRGDPRDRDGPGGPGADPQLTAQLDLMLAECYGRLGDDEQRLDALRRAAEGDQGPESARIELAQALARSGKLDQAVAILSPLADRKPELRLDLVRLLIQKTIASPGTSGTGRKSSDTCARPRRHSPRPSSARPCSASTCSPPRTAWTTPGRSCPRSWPRIPGTSRIGSRWPG